MNILIVTQVQNIYERNHKDTKTQRLHEVDFVLLRAFVTSWFKIQMSYYQIFYKAVSL